MTGQVLFRNSLPGHIREYRFIDIVTFKTTLIIRTDDTGEGAERARGIWEARKLNWSRIYLHSPATKKKYQGTMFRAVHRLRDVTAPQYKEFYAAVMEHSDEYPVLLIGSALDKGAEVVDIRREL